MDEQLGFEVTLNLPYAQAIEAVTAALKTQGFGVLTHIDVRATLKEKLGADFRPYVILGACNPPLAHRALQTDPTLGLLLPCNVTVEESGENTSLVRLTNPAMMVNFTSDPAALKEVAEQASQKIKNVVQALQDLGAPA